jgi:hypothetical protein
MAADQEIQPVPGMNGLSRFGAYYAPKIFGLPREALAPNFRREQDLERIRQRMFPERVSRLNCIFAAKTLDDAMVHVKRINSPDRVSTVNVFEVFTETFHDLDVMWLDIAGVTDASMQRRYEAYWAGHDSNDPQLERSPLREILIPLPARVGAIVKTVPLSDL